MPRRARAPGHRPPADTLDGAGASAIVRRQSSGRGFVQRLVLVAVVAVLLAPATAFAVDDVTPPVGSVSVVHDDRAAEIIRLNVAATDDSSGVATVEVSGNGTTWASFPYAPQVDWTVFDPLAGGSAALGDRTIRVRWTDAAGNVSPTRTTRLHLSPSMAAEFPVMPVTGQPFTIRPIHGPAYAPPSDATCSWELRWGDTTSLRDNKPNSTFGSLFTSGKPNLGFCGQWTFTIPEVPVRQFEIYFNGPTGGFGDADWPERAKFYPAAGSTDRRIRASNLPLVHVLPDTTTMVVGTPITYRAYPIGTTLLSTDTWMVFRPGDPIGPRYKLQYGGSSLTFTPNETGNWLVTWNGRFRAFDLNATYDPTARKPDLYRPNTTAPVQRIAYGTPGDTIPVRIGWSGTDTGWGIAKYRLERSVGGGAWKAVTLPTATATSIVQPLTRGVSYRFRVRATDKYGNVGYWDYGPTFTPRYLGDSNARIAYTGAWATEFDPTAWGGSLRRADAAGASARLEFVGRDVAWIAERGPGKGRAWVYVDGVLRKTVDLTAGGDIPRAVVYRFHWSTVGTHRIRIVVEGTAGHPVVTLDGFAILR